MPKKHKPLLPARARRTPRAPVGPERDPAKSDRRLPPKHARFVKGRSGNPKGRPKRPPTLERELREALEQALNRKIPIKEGDRTRVITLAQAGIEQLARQFAKGDRHARRDLFAMAERLGIDLARGAHEAESILLPEDHRRTLEAYVAGLVGRAPDPNARPRILAPPELLTDDDPAA